MGDFFCAPPTLFPLLLSFKQLASLLSLLSVKVAFLVAITSSHIVGELAKGQLFIKFYDEKVLLRPILWFLAAQSGFEVSSVARYVTYVVPHTSV